MHRRIKGHAQHHGICTNHTPVLQLQDLARTKQKGGGGLVHQSIFDIPCIPLNHIKLNSPKEGGGLSKEEPPFDTSANPELYASPKALYDYHFNVSQYLPNKLSSRANIHNHPPPPTFITSLKCNLARPSSPPPPPLHPHHTHTHITILQQLTLSEPLLPRLPFEGRSPPLFLLHLPLPPCVGS